MITSNFTANRFSFVGREVVPHLLPVPRHESEVTTIYFVSDTHYGTESESWNTSQYGPGTQRQVVALNEMHTRPHPGGGLVPRASVVIHLGDCVHESLEDYHRFGADYKRDGTGNVKYPCYILDGNHDNQPVRDNIIAEFGQIAWSLTLDDRVHFQAIGPDRKTNVPSVETFAGPVYTEFLTRPAGVPTFLLVHRALTGGYINEWDLELPGSDPRGALYLLAGFPDVLGIIHGHNHYSAHTTIDGFRVFSPGAVHQTGGTLYAETIMVLRIGDGWYDVGNYIFGFNVTHQWTPGVWEWHEVVRF